MWNEEKNLKALTSNTVSRQIATPSNTVKLLSKYMTTM
jgi:hypothetical protein